jgi:hypothetical protein
MCLALRDIIYKFIILYNIVDLFKDKLANIKWAIV